ncbi:hypothetical protein B0H14DRAFT_2620872 [Mycena olivaceomarginata]|nr:hypothetical protein B0H14DRAFT_2620872 [Mycena olivaceomarginata]
MPKDVSVDDDPEFPFPGEYTPNGFATQYICLAKLTNVQLSEHCKTFNLAFTGNKAALTDRLKDFSKDKLHWDRLIPGATNAHKGARKPQNEKKTKPKVSTIRRETLFQGADGVRTANAHRIVAKYPYQRNRDNSDTNASIYINPSVHVSSQSIAQLPTHRDGITAMQSNMLGASSDTPAVIRHATPAPPSTFVRITPGSTPSSDSSITPANMDVHMSPSSPDSGSDGEAPTRTLELAGGIFVTFCESDIPDPPAVSYARNIEDLLGVWNDRFPVMDWKLATRNQKYSYSPRVLAVGV